MIKVHPGESRFKVDTGWLVSRPSFQFGAYSDPGNSGFGVLRVFNDDFVAPGKGFGAHPHSDMEIVSIILKGEIRHEDNLGNIEITKAGEVQRISAGSGVIHAEYNPSGTEELNFLQMWFMPRERGTTPSYETSRYDPSKLINALHPVVTPTGAEDAASIQQDMTIYLGRLEAGRELEFRQEPGRRIYLFAIEGELTANGVRLGERDSARIAEVSELKLAAPGGPAFVLLIDLP
ncbi:pirin family protein [Cohnella thailandensis]|uniref:Pirin family protein n=1 Tax=Cohnella thailandensis TaxID=557557 RepID=A0A841SQ59_9BACL|nr:pirin family protein [Cohnella thailandensis]MBB6634094.1 pirin family protein [Cohnella thailandensis]MBP1972414.1 redox-sensitive bicupin YhaK (pirin superfamily) [Cohnella thailandensis]